MNPNQVNLLRVTQRARGRCCGFRVISSRGKRIHAANHGHDACRDDAPGGNLKHALAEAQRDQRNARADRHHQRNGSQPKHEHPWSTWMIRSRCCPIASEITHRLCAERARSCADTARFRHVTHRNSIAYLSACDVLQQRPHVVGSLESCAVQAVRLIE